MKAQIGYSRKVQTRQYENLTISYQIEFDTEQQTAESAFFEVSQFVKDKLEQELHSMGVTN